MSFKTFFNVQMDEQKQEHMSIFCCTSKIIIGPNTTRKSGDITWTS